MRPARRIPERQDLKIRESKSGVVQLDEERNEKIKAEKRASAMETLTGLVVLGLFTILLLHSITIGEGSLIFDIWSAVFMAITGLFIYLGVAFGILGVLAILAVAIALIYLMIKKKR
jgi:hypothetical protein